MKGATQCPRCASRRWSTIHAPSDFYADLLRVCVNCETIWEPFEIDDLLDPGEPLGAFKNPCGNCAFRKGSPEQRDPEIFANLRESLGWASGHFYCHKGIPISPASEHGFDYPADGKDPRKLRLCRGYLNQLKITLPE